MQFVQSVLKYLWFCSTKSIYMYRCIYTKTEILELRHISLATLGCFLKCKASLLNFEIPLHLFNFPTSWFTSQLNILLLQKDNSIPIPPKQFYLVKDLRVLYSLTNIRFLFLISDIFQSYHSFSLTLNRLNTFLLHQRLDFNPCDILVSEVWLFI